MVYYIILYELNMITESEDYESHYQNAMRWEEKGYGGAESPVEGGEGDETDGGEGEETDVILIDVNDNEGGLCSSGVSQLERDFSRIFYMPVL